MGQANVRLTCQSDGVLRRLGHVLVRFWGSVYERWVHLVAFACLVLEMDDLATVL